MKAWRRTLGASRKGAPYARSSSFLATKLSPRDIGLLLVLGSFSSALHAQHPAGARTIDAARRATAFIAVKKASGGFTGSGFVISPNGLLVTAAHVIDGASSASVRLPDGDTRVVTGVYRVDHRFDYAIIKMEGVDLPTITLGNSDSTSVGQRIYVVGAPEGFEATVSDGLLSGVRNQGDHRLFQISAPTSPGSSGGPILDEGGHAIGLVLGTWAEPGAQNLNFALPINYVRAQLGTIASQDAVPLSEAVRVTFGSSVHREAPPDPSLAKASVNDSLRIDPDVLDGVTFFEKDNNHIRTISTRTVYSKTLSPEGTAILERYVSSTWNEGNKDQYTDEWRTEVDRGMSTIHSYVQRTSYSREVAGYSAQALIDSGQYSLTGEGDLDRSGVHVPRGIVTENLLPAVIASLPDHPPRLVFVWVLSTDSLRMAAVPARIEFGDSSSIRVALSKMGKKCGPETAVQGNYLRATSVTVTIGARKEEFLVSAERPHVRLDNVLAPEHGQPTGCLSLPQGPCTKASSAVQAAQRRAQADLDSLAVLKSKRQSSPSNRRSLDSLISIIEARHAMDQDSLLKVLGAENCPPED